jgi:tetratricopeptide (TPR) repeat protein
MKRIGCVRMTLGGAAALAGFALGGGTILAPSVFAQAPQRSTQSARPTNDPALDSLLAKAQTDIDNKDYEAAAEKYQTYLAARPQDAQIHYQLGYAYTALQKMTEARAEYQKATDLDAKLAPAFLNLGLTELSSDPAAAATALSRAAELMPDQARPKLLLAMALAHSGKTDDAIAQYQGAEKIDPQDVNIRLGLAQTLRAAKRTTDAEREFRAVVALDGQNAQGHLGLGECLLDEKRLDEGANELGVYLQMRPNDEQVRLARVSALIDATKYDVALAELGQGSADAQDSVPALKLRFDALEGAKREDEALATLTRAETLAPQDAEIHSKLGQLYLGKKDYPRAALEFLAVVKIQPKNTQATALLADCEYLGKDYADALKAIDLLAQEETLPTRTLFVRADCYDKIGEKPEALDAYEKFLAANTDRNNDMYFAASERTRDLRRQLGKKQ